MAFNIFHFGLASIFVPTIEEFKEPRTVWLKLSSCLWVTYANAEVEFVPELLEPSRCSQCVTLHRLQSYTEWTNVERIVRCENTDHGTAILLQGTLTSGKYRDRTVEIGIVLEQEDARAKFLSVVRAKTAPWQLLYRRMLEWRSRPHHSKHVLECMENAGRSDESEDSCDEETTISFSMTAGHCAYRWVKQLTSLIHASRSLEDNADIKHNSDLELCVSIVNSIAYRLGSVEWNGLNDVGLDINLAYDNLFSVLHPNTPMDETRLRDFFETQEESLCALEAMEVECARRKSMTLSKRAVKSVISSLDRFCTVVSSLVCSGDAAERCDTSRRPYGCAWQYNCVARDFDELVECEAESDETVRNKHCFLTECASTTRRFLFEEEPQYLYVDLLSELVTTFEGLTDTIVQGRIYRECLDETRRLLGEGHVSERLLEMLMKLAETCVANDTRWEAIELYRESLAVSRQLYGHVDRLVIADILFEIGYLLDQDRSYDEARTSLVSCYEMRRRLGEEVDGSELANSVRVLADVLFKLDSLDEAEGRYRECLEIWEGIYGVGYDDVDIASALRWLAEALEKKGELDEAGHIFSECLSMRQRLFNEDDDTIAEVMFALGRFRAETGELDEAELLCRECVEMLRRIHGDHSDDSCIALALHELAKVHRRKGNFSEASRVHREFFDFLHERMDVSTYWWIKEETWCSSFSTKRMDMVKIDLNDRTEEVLRAALSFCENGDDECHQPNVVLAMHQLGGFLMRKSGRFGHHAGEKIIRESVSIVRELSGNDVDHWLVSNDRWFEVSCLQNIADWYSLSGLRMKAERLHQENLNILREVAGEKKDSLDIADCLRRLGKQIESKSRGSEKRKLLRESFEMVQRISGDSAGDFRRVVDALFHLVEFELEDGTGENLLSVCHDCLDLARRVHGEGVDHEDVARCFGFLGRIAMKQSDLERSERWYRLDWDMLQRLQRSVSNSSELNELGDLALKNSRFDDSERLFRERFDGSLSGLDCAVAFQVIAYSLYGAGKLQEAERVFLDCLKAYESFDVTKAGYHEDRCFYWHWDLRRKCPDRKVFCLNFLELRKELLPHGHLHPGIAVALLCFAGYSENSANAERWARECLIVMDRLFCDKGDDAFVSFVYFGLACSVGGQEAERLYRASLEMDRRLYGLNVTHADTCITMYALANLLVKQGELEEAEQLYRSFFKMHKVLFAEVSDSVFFDPPVDVKARIIFDLADAHLNQGPSSIGENLLRECVDVLREMDIDRTQHVDLAFALQKLASLVLDRGLFDEAKDLFRESLNLFGSISVDWDNTSMFPPSRFLNILSPSDECAKEAYCAGFKFHGVISGDSGVLFILNALGNIAWGEKCYEDAGKFFRLSLILNRIGSEGCENKLDILQPAFSLAEVRRHENSFEEAISLYREALDAYQDAYEDGYQDNAWPILFQLAVSLFENGQHNEAVKVLEDCRTVVEESFLGDIFSWKIDYWKSRVAYEECDMDAAESFIEKSRDVLGDDNFGMHVVLRMHALIVVERDKLEEAAKYARESLSVCYSLVSDRDEKGEETARTLCVLARVEIAKGELKEAEEYIREGFDLRREMHGTDADDAGIAELLGLRAEVLFYRGAKKEAINVLVKSVEMYQRVYKKTPNHRNVARAERQLDKWRNEDGEKGQPSSR